MVVTLLKIHYKRQNPKTIQYRKYKHFQQQSFNFELNNDMNNAELNDCFKVLYKYAPKKEH